MKTLLMIVGVAALSFLCARWIIGGGCGVELTPNYVHVRPVYSSGDIEKAVGDATVDMATRGFIVTGMSVSRIRNREGALKYVVKVGGVTKSTLSGF